jgi:hypothetical protein
MSNKKERFKAYNEAYQKEIDRKANMTPEELLDDRVKKISRVVTNHIHKLSKDFSIGLGLDKI